MSDSPVIDPKVQAVAQDVLDDAALAKTATARFRAGGLNSLAPLLPQIISAAQRGYTDVSAALPAIKAGMATTEFWLTLAVFLGNGIYLMVAGKALPVDLNLVMGAVVAIYTAARALVKSSAATAAASVAVAQAQASASVVSNIGTTHS